MSIEGKLWMGNLEKWMNEKEIMNFFSEYNFYPKNIQLIKDKKKDSFYNYCFIDFCNIYEANEALINLQGKTIPNTNSTFDLKWANTNSKNIDIYVGNLAPEIDNFELYNLFKEKYPSVHHASIMINNNTSRRYGFVNFSDKKESENCVREMDGFIFHNRVLKVQEKRINNNKKKNYEKNESVKTENESKKIENQTDGIVNLDGFVTIELIGILNGHNAPVTSLICSEDEKGTPLLLSGSKDASIIKWRLFFKDNKFEANQICDKKDGLILGEPKKKIKKHSDSITCLSLSSDGRTFVSSSLDTTIIIWDMYNLTLELIIKDSYSEVLAAWFSSDDDYVFWGEKSGEVKYKNRKGEVGCCAHKSNSYVTCFVKILYQKKNYFAIGLSDGTVEIYNSDFKLQTEIPSHKEIKCNKDIIESKDEGQNSVVSLTVDNEEGEFLFIGERNGAIKIFRFKLCFDEDKDNNGQEEDKFIHYIQNHNEINNILFEIKFFSIIFIGDSKGFTIMKIKPVEQLFRDDYEACFSLCFDKNKNYIFAGFGNGIIKVYHLIKL